MLMLFFLSFVFIGCGGNGDVAPITISGTVVRTEARAYGRPPFIVVKENKNYSVPMVDLIYTIDDEPYYVGEKVNILVCPDGANWDEVYPNMSCP